MSKVNLYQLNKQEYDTKHTLYVDNTTIFPTVLQTGTPSRPFSTIQQAIDYAVSIGDPSWNIRISFGVHTGTLTIPANFDFIFEGIIRIENMIIVGPINWTVTGNRTSRIGFKNLVVGQINIIDDIIPAVNAIAAFENCKTGLISTTGTSFVSILMGGISIANFNQTNSLVVAGVIENDINITNGELLLQNIQVRSPTVLLKNGSIHANGCSFSQNIELTNAKAEFTNCIWIGTKNLTFTGTTGTAYFDGFSDYNFTNTSCSIINGSKVLRNLGVSVAEHKSLRQLVHLADRGPFEGFLSNAYREIISSPFPTSIIWYVDNTKTQKIVEKNITYNGCLPQIILWKAYDTDGVSVVSTVSDYIGYNGIFEISRTRIIS